MIQKNINRVIILLISVYAINCNFNLNGTCSKSIAWDAYGYYAYLPSTLLSDDIGNKEFNKIEALNKKYHFSDFLYQYNTLTDGTRPIRYSCGVALVSSPFFLLGHITAKLTGKETDGYSLPYQYWFNVSNLFWLVIGFIAFNKLLKLFFSITTVNLILLIIFLGTNFIHSVVKSFGMTHLFEFTFYSIFLLQIINYYKHANKRKSLLIGITLGLITVIRPINILSIILFICWDINPFDFKQLKERVLFLKKNFLFLIITCLGFLFAFLPQILYWKKVTGLYLYQGYANPQEGLDILNPHTSNFLFSFRKGWLLYSPLMLFSIIGFYYLVKSKAKFALALILFSVINIFLLSTWTCWWYASSYGQRTMVDTYPILAIPIGFFIDNIKQRNWITRVIFYGTILLLICWNIFKMWQFNNWILHSNAETKPHYLNNLFTLEKQNDDSLLLVPRNYDDLFQMKRKHNYTPIKIYQTNFDNPDDFFSDALVCESKNNFYKMKVDREFTTPIHFPYYKLTKKTHSYIKVSFDCLFTKKYAQNKFGLVELFQHDTLPYSYNCIELKPSQGFDTTSNRWNHYEMFLLTPEVRSKNDNFITYFWNYGHNELLIDNFVLESFVPIFDPQ